MPASLGQERMPQRMEPGIFAECRFLHDDAVLVGEGIGGKFLGAIFEASEYILRISIQP